MLEIIYNQTITILNKLKRTDTNNLAGPDLWYKHTINDAAWYTKAARTASGSGVYIGTYITVLIPFHDDFMDYLDWRELDTEGKQENFTMSSGDYVILGDVPEEITANNVVATMQKYGEHVCQVKSHAIKYNRFGAFVQMKIEGV